MITFNNNWDNILKNEFEKPYYLELREFLIKEYNTQTIFPNKNKIYEAFKLTDYNDVKVVILGQDPYHGQNQAHGLAFSVSKGIAIPPSLQNIYKELHEDVGFVIPKHGHLIDWATQGVLLLNTALTVRKGEANSHRGKGWETLTDEVIKLLGERNEPIVFLLWGNNASSKEKYININKHLVLKAPHPSPLSAYRGFLGCKHFSKANKFLEKNNIAPINWQL